MSDEDSINAVKAEIDAANRVAEEIKN